MIEFKKYQHVERLGNTEVEGILDGEVLIFPKIDGTNGCIWYDGTTIHCGSRNRELTLDNDNHGFMKYVCENPAFAAFFVKCPDVRLYGEWLVPHSLKTYRDDAWRKFYVFDIRRSDGSYVPYIDYTALLDELNIDYIPPIGHGLYLTEEKLRKVCEINTFLLKDGSGCGEGIVIKRYDFENKFGRTVWAKIVTSEFKDKHVRAMGPQTIVEKDHIEIKIAAHFVTMALVDKVFQKIHVDNHFQWESKFIPRLLNTVFYDLVREESWAFIKRYKNPTIDFKKLLRYTVIKIKTLKPDLF